MKKSCVNIVLKNGLPLLRWHRLNQFGILTSSFTILIDIACWKMVYGTSGEKCNYSSSDIVQIADFLEFLHEYCEEKNET